MSTTIDPAVDDSTRAPSTRRSRRWRTAVSVVLVAWLGAQVVAGWKYANGRTYPIVGSAMFNGPPSGSGGDFMEPRVFAISASGQRTEMDQHTFDLEPFEWRRWIKRHLEDVGDAAADGSAAALAAEFDAPTTRRADTGGDRGVAGAGAR